MTNPDTIFAADPKQQETAKYTAFRVSLELGADYRRKPPITDLWAWQVYAAVRAEEVQWGPQVREKP